MFRVALSQETNRSRAVGATCPSTLAAAGCTPPVVLSECEAELMTMPRAEGGRVVVADGLGRAYGGRVTAASVPWRALLVRLFLVVPAAQVLGVLLMCRVVTSSGLIRAHPGTAGHGLSLGAGIIAGLAVGVLVNPVHERLRTYVAVSAGFGFGVYVVLTLLARLQLPDGVPPPLWSTVILGALLVVGPQTLVAWRTWAFRHRSR